MARAKDQARWRARSDRRRIEAYLPAETLARLDAFATSRGVSRTAALIELIDAATADPEAPAESAGTDPGTSPEPVSAVVTAAAERRSYLRGLFRWRRDGADWLVVIDGETVARVRRTRQGEAPSWWAALKPPRWRAESPRRPIEGRYGTTREDAALMFLDALGY